MSALVGVVAYKLIPTTSLAVGVAVGGAILVMSILRCLHPPGGAAALTAVIGGPSIHTAGYSFALLPVGLNSLALVCLGIAFHRFAARSYPHQVADLPIDTPAGFHLADIDAALENMHESFDIGREDLDSLLTRAEIHSQIRRGQRAREQ